MKIAKYNNLQDLPDNYSAWKQSKPLSLFGQPNWYDLLHKHIVKHDEQLIYYCVLNKNDHIEAVFPLVKSPNGVSSGYTLKSLANFYTMEYEPFFISKARNCRKALKVFSKYLATEEQTWTSLEFFPIDQDKLINIYLKQELSQYFTLSSSLCHKNWTYHNTDENFKEYIAFSPSRIKDIRRKERRLVKNYSVKFVMWIDDTDIEKCIQDYLIVYHGSWKDEEQYPDFIPDLILLCAGEKTLRLGILYINDVPTAAQFNIFHDKTTLIYKLCYDEKYKTLSAGAILSFKMMECAFDQDKSTKIDYGCGDDKYKKEWMNHCQERMTLTIYNNNLRGRYASLMQSLKARIKHLITPNKHREN